MGVSYDKHREIRERPWPRWRLGIWNAMLCTWLEAPRLYYTLEDACKAAAHQYDRLRGQGLRVVKVRVMEQPAEAAPWVERAGYTTEARLP